jgi:hypothetical protein
MAVKTRAPNDGDLVWCLYPLGVTHRFLLRYYDKAVTGSPEYKLGRDLQVGFNCPLLITTQIDASPQIG